MTNYIVSVQDRRLKPVFSYVNGWCQTPEQMRAVCESATFVSNFLTPVLVHEMPISGVSPDPIARDTYAAIDPEDSNHVIVYVATLSGRPLFHFDFYLTPPEPEES